MKGIPSRSVRAGVATPDCLRCRAGVSRHAPELNAAWQREALAEAFVDALAAAQPGGWLVEVDAPGSTCLRQLPLAEAVHYPREPVEAWLERLREALDFYDEDLVRRELEGAWG